MKHKILIDFLKRYGNISEQEEQNIQKICFFNNAKKKEILLHKGGLCNRLFFVTKGLLRAYYMDEKGDEITRRIAWEHGFIANMDNFRKNEINNNETIECIENAEFLEISKSDFDHLLSASENLTRIYLILLEKYLKINVLRIELIAALNPMQKLIYFNDNCPKLNNRVSDSVLATFLAISRKTLERMRKKLLGK
jgi:CRP-like cAMP-binding protein